MSRLYGSNVIKDKLLNNVSAAVKEVHRFAVEDEQRIVTNDNWQLHSVLEQLDFALLFGLRKVSDGYYPVVKEFTPKLLTRQIESLLNICTDIGRGRAWLFISLTDNLTESYLKCFQENRKFLKRFYTSDSITLDEQRLAALITLVSGLENIQFDIKADVVYLDRSCWPTFLEVEIPNLQKLNLPGVRPDIPSFSDSLARYDIKPPSHYKLTTHSPRKTRHRTMNSGKERGSTASSLVNSFISTDTDLQQNRPISRSSSVSYDNPSIETSTDDTGSNIIQNNQTTITITPLSSSLSEVDPFMVRQRSVSEDYQQQQQPLLEQNKSTEEHISLEHKNTPVEYTNNFDNQSSLETPTLANDNLSINDETTDFVVDGYSENGGLEDENQIRQNNHDLLQKIDDIDPIELSADANLQLHFMLEVYEMPNDGEEFIKLFCTTIGHNQGNLELVYILITSLNVYVLRKQLEVNGSLKIEKLESVRLEQIELIECGPNEQYLRLITTRRYKLPSWTTGSSKLTKAICNAISFATAVGRYVSPKISAANMQEISIKKFLAIDLKRSAPSDVSLLRYSLTFWEEPQLTGKNLRKEGLLYTRVSSPPMQRLARLAVKQKTFETWKATYVTLRADRLNIYTSKSDKEPVLSYALLDENCQGCRRNRTSDRPFTVEIMFTNDVTLLLAAKTKIEQDEWLNAIMKAISQGRLAFKDDMSSNTVPCSAILTDEKLYVCHEEQDSLFVRFLDTIKLDYIVRLYIDANCKYYCILEIEQGKSQNSKYWIFYFLFCEEMLEFMESIQKAVSNVYQVLLDIQPVVDTELQRDCQRTSNRLISLYRSSKLS